MFPRQSRRAFKKLSIIFLTYWSSQSIYSKNNIRYRIGRFGTYQVSCTQYRRRSSFSNLIELISKDSHFQLTFRQLKQPSQWQPINNCFNPVKKCELYFSLIVAIFQYWWYSNYKGITLVYPTIHSIYFFQREESDEDVNITNESKYN